MACLNHPNIIKIRDVGVAAGYPFFALEYAANGSLAALTRGSPQPVRPPGYINRAASVPPPTIAR